MLGARYNPYGRDEIPFTSQKLPTCRPFRYVSDEGTKQHLFVAALGSTDVPREINRVITNNGLRLMSYYPHIPRVSGQFALCILVRDMKAEAFMPDSIDRMQTVIRAKLQGIRNSGLDNNQTITKRVRLLSACSGKMGCLLSLCHHIHFGAEKPLSGSDKVPPSNPIRVERR